MTYNVSVVNDGLTARISKP